MPCYDAKVQAASMTTNDSSLFPLQTVLEWETLLKTNAVFHPVFCPKDERYLNPTVFPVLLLILLS